MAKNTDWTRDELILAINLYFKTPFYKITNRNPDIINLANLIDRTASAVFKKLIQFECLDTILQARDKSGPMNCNRQDREILDEFSENPAKLEYESERILKQYIEAPSDNWKAFIAKSDLSARASNVLIHNFSSLEELLSFDEAELSELPNSDVIIAKEIVWYTLIAKSDLSPRASNVLIRNFSSLEELLDYDVAKLFKLPGSDITIEREIVAFIQSLEDSDSVPVRGDEIPDQIFNDEIPVKIIPKRVKEAKSIIRGEESLKWNTFIVNSNLSPRTSRILIRNFSSLEELLSFDEAKFLQLPKCDSIIAKEIKTFIKKLENSALIDTLDDSKLSDLPAEKLISTKIKKTKKSPEKKIRDSEWERLIKQSKISVRASNVLLQNFSSLEEFKSFNSSYFYRLENCGRKTANELILFMDELSDIALDDSPIENESCIKNISDSEWENLINQSKLSLRATNVLLQNFSSLEELLSCGRDQLFKLKNSGLKTVNEVTDFIIHLKNKIKTTPSGPEKYTYTPSLKDIFSQPPDNSTFKMLPIYNGKTAEDISISELHPKFNAYALLSDIDFSARTTKILRGMGLKTVGQVMCTPQNMFMEQKNFGRKCLKEIQLTIKQIMFENLLDDSIPKRGAPPTDHAGDSIPDFISHEIHPNLFIDYSSYVSMVHTFLKHAIKSDRNQKVIFDRLCFLNAKIPTLEELGEKHEVTRERARQIIFKATNILKIKSNFKKLAHFWSAAEKIIHIGGGVIHLDALAAALKDEFNWPQMPSPLALGQLLSLWLHDRKLKETSTVIEIDCECLSCDRPLKTIQSFDFESNESFHLKVVGKKLLDDCQKNCEHTSGPVLTLHDAFIEKVVSSSGGGFIIKGELLYPYNKWAVKFGKSLEDAIAVVLKKQGRPMHYSEIGLELRKESSILEGMTDHNVHASLSRYRSVELVERGTFALKEWGMVRYQSVSDAIEELLKASYYPMHRQNIIAQLKEEFSEGNISASLSERTTRFIAIGDGFYDCLDRWQKRTCHDFMKELPGELHEFMTYLVTNNNCSYKLVVGLVFIRGMNDDGTMPISTLKERFYNFFAARHAKGLVVEKDEVFASKINMLDPIEFKNLTLKNPINSFLNSGFFIKTGASIMLQSGMIPLLNMVQFKDIVSIILLKSINEYFSAIELPLETEYAIRIGGAKISNAANDVSASESESSQEYENENTTDIAIKKIKRVKIQL